MNRNGFTLIEMAIVVAMIAIIALLGFPKIRTALDKTGVRSARVSITTFVAQARAVATQRGCRGVIHFAGGAASKAWVTVCPRLRPGSGVVDTVAVIEDLGDRFAVQMTFTRDSVQYDPRGLSMDNASTIVRFTGNVAANTDSVVINSLGRVAR